MPKKIINPCQLRSKLAQMGMKAINNDMYCTNNFSWWELLQDQTELPSLDVLKNLKITTTVLQVYRDQVFRCPIIITSGWRSKVYNKSIGGAKHSLHIEGKALDFKPLDWSIPDVYAMMDKIHFGGVEKTGGDWQHIDIRPKNVRFTPKNIILESNYEQKEHDKIFHPQS